MHIVFPSPAITVCSCHSVKIYQTCVCLVLFVSLNISNCWMICLVHPLNLSFLSNGLLCVFCRCIYFSLSYYFEHISLQDDDAIHTFKRRSLLIIRAALLLLSWKTLRTCRAVQVAFNCSSRCSFVGTVIFIKS